MSMGATICSQDYTRKVNKNCRGYLDFSDDLDDTVSVMLAVNDNA